MKTHQLQSDTSEHSSIKPQNRSDQSQAILRLQATAFYLGISLPTLWRKEKTDPTFPNKIKLGSRARGYRKADLDAWLASQEVQS